MNLRQLRSLAAIRKYGSFASAGARIGLSQSAVSVQMQQLEQALGTSLFERGHRPVTLSPEGSRIADIADEILERLERMQRVARGSEFPESVAIGFVPTTVHYLLPRVLEALRDAYPELQVRVRSGLSGELSALVARRELDYALLTAPVSEIPELRIATIASEAFYVIGPASHAAVDSDAELLRSLPYIAFNRRTWVGQYIASRLQQRGIHVNQAIEIDSLEAIENLVARGFGVSIVPRRLHAPAEGKRLAEVPFGNPADTRRLALASHVSRPDSPLDRAVRRIFADLPGARPASAPGGPATSPS